MIPERIVNITDIQKEIKDTLARLSNKGGKSKSSKNSLIAGSFVPCNIFARSDSLPKKLGDAILSIIFLPIPSR